MITALFIDTELKETKTVEIETKNGDIDLHQCYKLMNCDLVEFVYFGDKEILIVDEEGLLKANTFFQLKGVGQEIFAGKALIVQEKREKCISIDAEKISELKERISFPSIVEIREKLRRM